MSLMYSIWALCAGFLLDLLLGDPPTLAHPVRLMGKAIQWGEGIFRGSLPNTPFARRIGGALLSIFIVLLALLLPLLILLISYTLHPLLGFLIESIMCYTMLAARSLKDESMKVYRALLAGDIKQARSSLSMIVGRDTQKLERADIARAAVETVAENTCDGVVAPLFFMAIGGAPLGFFYKAANTLDSMIGYKNEQYLNFGRFAARLDDCLNFIPARIAAVLMIVCAPVFSLDFKRAFYIYRRDRKNHPSPNSAQTESVCAGALGIELGGEASYGGVAHRKPTIGDKTRNMQSSDIVLANLLMLGASCLALVLFCGIKLVIMRVLMHM